MTAHPGIVRAALLLAMLLPACAGAATAPPDTIRIGTLTLQACEIGRPDSATGASAAAYCAGLDVPEQWDAPSSRHIRLQLAWIRSDAARSDPDPVVFLDGGPGGAARDDYPSLAPAFSVLRQRHDVLLVDQRGTGGSNALTCADLSGAAAQSGEASSVAASAQQVRHCLSVISPHADARFYTTSDAIRDLEAVRRTLGIAQFNLLGISYGTRVAQQYAGRYPRAVRSLVLDSAVPNRLALGGEHARNLELALKALFARCAAEHDCAAAFGDSYATLYRVRDRLRRQSPTITVRDPVSFAPSQQHFSADDLASLVRFYAYNPLTSALLPLLLHEADQGDYAPLLGQKTLLDDDLGAAISSGEELSVVCAEDADLLASNRQDEQTLMGNDTVSRMQAACALWPRGARPAHFHEPLRSSVPTLILAGEHDPVTPPSYAQEIARTLTRARVLLAPGQGHGVIMAGCMPKLVADFVSTLQPQRLDARCLQRLGETAFFTSYAGSAP